MYVNELGMGGITSHADRSHTGKTGTAKNTGNTENINSTNSISNTDSYAAILQKALSGQNTSIGTASLRAGDIIIREALEKMKEDPEWEDAVMSKIKEEVQTDYSADFLSGYLSAGLSASQALSGNLAYSPYNLGLYNYSSAGLGNLAASSYKNVMNNTYNTSLLGNWLL